MLSIRSSPKNCVYPFPNINFIHCSLILIYINLKQQILDSSKLKDFADNNFEFDENGREFTQKAENTVVKGEIPCYEQFLLLPLCFQKTYCRQVKTRACLGKC